MSTLLQLHVNSDESINESNDADSVQEEEFNQLDDNGLIIGQDPQEQNNQILIRLSFPNLYIGFHSFHASLSASN